MTPQETEATAGPALPAKAAGAGPDQAILAFTPLDVKIIRGLNPGGRDLKPLLGGMTGLCDWPDLILAGPILGAPQAVMVLEQLRRRGVSVFWALGWCGSLRPELNIGDIVLPEAALSEEGTSAHYPLDGPPAGADPELCRALKLGLEGKKIKHAAGKVWTTDAPFRETREKVRKYGEKGILAVDMEASALMTTARFHGLKYAALMVVSDELEGEKWKPGFDSPRLKESLKEAARVILDAARARPRPDAVKK